MADVLKWVLGIAALLAVFVSYWLTVVALFPMVVARAQAQYHRPFKLIGLGLVTIIPLLIGAILLFKLKNPVFQLSGSVLLGGIVAIGLLGSSGLAQRIGHGLPSPLDEAQPWRRVYRGGSVLALVFLLPFVGWFVILPVTLITGFGAALLSYSSAKASPTPPARVETQPMMENPATS